MKNKFDNNIIIIKGKIKKRALGRIVVKIIIKKMNGSRKIKKYVAIEKIKRKLRVAFH